MSPTRKDSGTPEQIAAMLRAGTPYSHIKRQLHVGHATIHAVREAHGIALTSRALDTLPDDQRRATILNRHPRVAELLHAGATYRQITAETGIGPPTISLVRKTLGIPIPDRRKGFAPTRTIAETLTHYTQPQPDGHAHWTGPRNGTRPAFWHQGRPHQARRETFRAHHGREPQGRVQVGCTDPACIAGAHLTDDHLRAEHRAQQHLDAQYTAIFGPDAP